MRRRILILMMLCLLLAQLPAAPRALAESQDWPVQYGHFFTQTGGRSGGGFAVTDEGEIPFWSTFHQLGGVDSVGYPISHRFVWEGFTVQAFQRVVFQWNPNDRQVQFVNVFDRLSVLGHDDWLTTVRQTPAPISLEETGKDWAAIVQGRLALLDERPAIREKYHAAAGDAIQMNGLPTSAVTDMGNHYALRAQRIVLQEWKEDVPWAKQGAVTVALGGDIAKERGLFPAEALDPAVVYVHPVDGFSIRVPSRWTRQGGTSVSRVILAGPIEGKGASPSVTVLAAPRANGQDSRDLFPGRPMPGYKVLSEEQITLNGHPATRRVYVLGSAAEAEMKTIEVTLTHGETAYTLNAAAASARFDRHASTFDWMLASFTFPSP